jgi:prephenate dehydratase
MEKLTLKIAVLDPKEKHSTYSYQEAKKFAERLRIFALGIRIILLIEILPCENHQKVIDSLKSPNTISLQPIVNTSTGLVPVSAYGSMLEMINQITIYAGDDLLIENHLIRNQVKPIVEVLEIDKDNELMKNQVEVDLLDPKNYKYTRYILTHKAPEGQCKAKIEEIKSANPDVVINNDFDSTTDAVNGLKMSQYADGFTVAIGNAETTDNLNFVRTPKPWQDYPENNITTFLAVAIERNLDPKLVKLLRDFAKENSNPDKTNFIASLPIENKIGSLKQFLIDLRDKYQVNLNYIKVKCEEGDLKSVSPFFSGTVPTGLEANLDAFLKGNIKNGKVDLAASFLQIQDEELISPNISSETEIAGPVKLIIKEVNGIYEIEANVPNYKGGLIEILEKIENEGIDLTSLEVFARGCEPFAVLKAKGIKKM